MADPSPSTPDKPGSGAEKAHWWHDRRKLAAAIGGVVLVIGIGAAIAYNAVKRPDDVHNADVPFTTEEPHKPVLKTTNWPMYGYNRRHTRYLPASKVKPPF